jgi:hypothetical protein
MKAASFYRSLVGVVSREQRGREEVPSLWGPAEYS